jgi:hypothetical protein
MLFKWLMNIIYIFQAAVILYQCSGFTHWLPYHCCCVLLDVLLVTVCTLSARLWTRLFTWFHSPLMTAVLLVTWLHDKLDYIVILYYMLVHVVCLMYGQCSLQLFVPRCYFAYYCTLFARL